MEAVPCRWDALPGAVLPGAAPRPLRAPPSSPSSTSSALAAARRRAPQLRKLSNFQWAGVERILELGTRCLLADEMGCGKTPQAMQSQSERAKCKVPHKFFFWGGGGFHF